MREWTDRHIRDIVRQEITTALIPEREIDWLSAPLTTLIVKIVNDIIKGDNK